MCNAGEGLVKLEKGITDLRHDVKVLSEQVLRLSVTNEAREGNSAIESEKIREIDRDMQQAKGVLTFVKFISTIGGSGVLGLLVWLLSSQNAMQQRISDVNQRVALMEAVVSRVDNETRNQINKLKVENAKQEASTHNDGQ